MIAQRRPGFAVWLTGLPSSGKTTLAAALHSLLAERGVPAQLLDSDELRRVLTPDPAYTSQKRDWFYGVLVWLAGLMTDNGVNVLIAATAPRRVYREAARGRIDRCSIVHVDCPAEVCRARDPKGLWRRSAEGEIVALPGAGAAYEPPPAPDVRVNTAELSIEEAAQQILHALEGQGWVARQ
jgi:adenylylsulfate kinase